MKWSSVLFTFLLGLSFENCTASTATSSTKSPQKKLSISTFSSPRKLDSRTLRSLNDFARSPLKVSDKDTSRLALDFDALSTDKSFPSTLFNPKEESIYSKDSWTVPLNKVEDMKNLMNLESKMADIRVYLKEELVDNASSLGWVSDGERLVNFILVVSTSISQLSYLISRLAVTDCSIEVSKRITRVASDHLKTLADFCEDIMGYSGRVGMTFTEGKLKNPEEYFESLFSLREEVDLEMSDEMFQIFIEFFFGAYASEFPESVIKSYMENVDSSHWTPLPIIYFRERMLIENPEDFALFISHWKERVFDVDVFDSRNLVNIGYLLQLGILTKKTLFSFIESIRKHKSQFKFNKEMIKFLTLMASTPWLLPEDQDAALLIGNFSYSSTGSEFIAASETDKKALMNFLWDFFIGSADFSEIEIEEYENLCKLIQRLDFAFPGISSSLWSHIKSRDEGNDRIIYVKGDEVLEMFKWKIELFDEIQDLNEKIEFLNLNFSDEKTIESDLIDSETLLLLLNFFTDVFADSVEYVVEGESTDFALEHQKILNICIRFIDSVLIKFAHKSVINFWYEALDFYPTKLFNALNDLWMISGDGFTKLTPTDCLIWENVNKLVDYNERFARIFMLTLKSKTGKFSKPAFSAKMSTPKCLILSGEANSFNFEYFQEILEISKDSNNEIFDEFFLGLSDKLAKGEIQFDSVKILFERILENNLKIKISGYSTFWNPFLMIHLTKQVEPAQHEHDLIMNSFKLYLRMNTRSIMEIAYELLMNVSVFMGFNQFVHGALRTEKIETSRIDSLTITLPQPSEVELLNTSSSLFFVFCQVIIDGVNLKDANIIFSKLIEIAKVVSFFVVDYKNTSLLSLVFAFNSLLLSIIRIPEFVMPDEERSVIILNDFYLKFKECSPYYNENLLKVLRQRSSIVAFYSNLIKNYEALPSIAFDNIKDSRITLKIQQNYVKMLVSNPENMTISKLNPITSWIKKGKMDPSTFLKLLDTIEYDQHRIFANCLPLVAEFIKNDQISVKNRSEALEIIFSQDNNQIIKSMANRRLYILHENFINLFVNGPADVIKSFLDMCNEEDWYVGVKTEIERIKNQKIFQTEEKNSSNFYIKDEGYLRDLMSILNAPLPDYALRSSIVFETDAFVGKMAHMLPILRDSITNGPLESCFFHLISANLQITDGLAFFKHYANPETFLILLRMQDILFKKSYKRRTVLSWILESIRITETRKAAAKMLPHLITTDNFVLYSGVFRVLRNWFNDDFEFENYLVTLVNSAFDTISCADSTIECAPVLDEMFLTLSEGFIMKIEAISSGQTVHYHVLCGLAKLKEDRKDLIEKSKHLMGYMKALIENMTITDLFIKVLDILKDFPSFYLKNKMEWIIIWKKLIQKLPFEFYKTPHLSVFTKFGNAKLPEWKLVFHCITQANLPSKVLTRLFIELADEGKEQDLDILQLLPDKIEFDHVSNYGDVETLLEYIDKCFEFFEDEEEALTKKIYEKLFVLLDFNVKIGGARSWNWRSIFKLSDSDRKMEKVVLKSLTVNFPDLLEKSCGKVEEILQVLFEINVFNDKTPTDFNEILMKAVDIYDRISGTVSSNFETAETVDYLKGKLHVLMVENLKLQELLDLYLFTLKEFKNVLKFKERNDRVAIDSFTFIFALANEIFSKTASELKTLSLEEFCDLFVDLVHDILISGNLVGFALAVDPMNLENLISSISYHVREKVEEFKFIISELMKFATIEVSDLFYQQISESDFRVDICFFTNEIISQFDAITEEEFSVPNASWPVLYLRTMIESDTEIDEEHFRIFEHLLEQVSDEIIPDQILIHIGNLVRSRPNYISNIFDLIDNLNKNFSDDFTLDVIYEKFLTDSIVKSLLTETTEGDDRQKQKFIRFLKEMQKKSSEEFNRWELNILEPETRNLVTKTLQSEKEALLTSIHTGVADKMIPRISEVDFSKFEQVETFLNGFKNLKTNYVQVPVMFSLESVFVNRLSEALNTADTINPETVSSIQNCVKFLLNFPVFESETFDNLMKIAFKVFSEQILTILIEKTENREGLKTILMTFKDKIDFGMWKNVKQKLQRFKLWEDEEILMSLTKNSEPSQFIELFSSFKNLPLFKKFELLENCRIINGYEKVNKLINFYKTISVTNDKIIVLKSMMRNENILNCFLNIQKNNLKNKFLILSLLKSNFKLREILNFSSDSDSSILKIIINLYFKPSSTKDPIIPNDFDNLKVLRDLFNCYFYEIQNDTVIKNKTPMYMKAFRLYNEIEEKQKYVDTVVLTQDTDTLILMTTGLDASLKSSNIFISSPQTIYAIYKLTRGLVTKKKERYSIISKLLFTTKPIRVDLVEAFLRAQVDSGNIDWRLHKELEDNVKNNERISDILFNFELHNYS